MTERNYYPEFMERLRQAIGRDAGRRADFTEDDYRRRMDELRRQAAELQKTERDGKRLKEEA
jgi:hypothetical protein